MHEMAHAIAAMLLTGKGVTVFIGSFGNKEKSSRFSVGNFEIWFLRNILKWKGGSCKAEQEMPPAKEFIYILAGPLFSFFVCCSISYWFFYLQQQGIARMAFVFILVYGVIILTKNLIPRLIRTDNGEGIYTDGYYLFNPSKLKKVPEKFTTAMEFYNKEAYTKVISLAKELKQEGIKYENMYRLEYCSYIMLKDFSKGYDLLQEMEKSFKLNSDDYYNMSYISDKLCLPEQEIIKYINRSIKLDSSSPHIYNFIGYRLNRANKYAEAIPYLDEVIAETPGYSYAYNNRGHAKIELGQLTDGLNDICRSLELNMDNSYVYRNLGIYYLKTDKPDVAKSFFLKAKQMDSDTEMIEELLSKV